jgi:isopentenyl-diphosphate delta-isomerase type 1
MTEYFDVLDNDGNIIGTATREECHNGSSFLIHAVVHVLVFNDKNELLLQKRSQNKKIQPGKWDTSIGGHIESGESREEALAREAKEELGITGVEFEYLYSYTMKSDIEYEFVTTYKCIWNDEDIDFQQEEIDKVKFFSTEEIEQLLGTGYFTPNFEDEWTYYKRYLDNS